MGDRLRPSWDWADLEATERRFQELLENEPTAEGRAEVLTQLARIAGLRGNFDEGDRLIDEAEAAVESGAVVRARIALERGRLRRSSGDPRDAMPLFESACDLALEADEAFIAVDAAHMAALVAADRDARLAWTDRAVGLARDSVDPDVTYWLGPLFNNLGWEYYSAGEYEPARSAFEEALAARERDADRPAEIEIARYALGKTLRALGRADEAAALLEQAVAWARRRDEPDGWFEEELAEDYAALGRHTEAREHARLALPLLLAADPSFADDAERASRLRQLAGEVD